MNTMLPHYCEKHNTKFYKNEKVDKNGQTKVWYSHKMLDGSGFCTENMELNQQIGTGKMTGLDSASSQKMLMCNAMNNSVALASAGKIQVDQVGIYYQKILSELVKSSVSN